MLTFEPSFFDTQERCGFTVDQTMKTCWAAEMELLYDIDQVCQKYDIPYFVYYGTMLGAVRHQGFIPWDDDIDIALLRDDYERLMSVLKDELPDSYVVHNALRDEDATEYWSSVVNSDYISIEPERLQKFHGCPFIVGLDIYPLDFIPPGQEAQDEIRKQFSWAWTTNRLVKKEDKSIEEQETLMSLLGEIERRFNTQIDRDKPLSAQLVRLANRIAACVNEEDESHIAVYHNFLDWPWCHVEKSCYAAIEWMPFENIYVPVAAGYDKILTFLYGDYHELKIRTQSHDYPFYNRQLELLRKLSEQRK